MLKFEYNGTQCCVRFYHFVPVTWVSRDGLQKRNSIGTRCTLVMKKGESVSHTSSFSILHPKDKNYCRATGRRVSFERLMKKCDYLAFVGWKAFWTAFPRKGIVG